MFRLIILLIIVPALSYTQDLNIQQPKIDKPKRKGASQDIVILPQFHGVIFDSSFKATTLTDKEVANVKKLLNKKLHQEYAKVRLKDYRNQLVPAVNNKGEKVVYVNGFCDAPSDWLTNLVSARDGGFCYYQAMLNLSQQRFSLFQFNGIAKAGNKRLPIYRPKEVIQHLSFRLKLYNNRPCNPRTSVHSLPTYFQ